MGRPLERCEEGSSQQPSLPHKGLLGVSHPQSEPSAQLSRCSPSWSGAQRGEVVSTLKEKELHRDGLRGGLKPDAPEIYRRTALCRSTSPVA